QASPSEMPTVLEALRGEATVVGETARATPEPVAKPRSGQKLLIAAVAVSVLSLVGVATLFLSQNRAPPPTSRYVVVSKDAPQAATSAAADPAGEAALRVSGQVAGSEPSGAATSATSATL